MEMLLNIIDHFSDVIHSITQWTQVTRPGAACTDTDRERLLKLLKVLIIGTVFSLEQSRLFRFRLR